MASFPNIKWVRLTPDRPGRGGMKTGIHSFQQQPVNDVRFLGGVYVHQGAWRREFDPTSYPSPQTDDPTGVFPLALHGYVYPSLTDPSAAPGITILSHHQHPGGNVVWDFKSPGGGIRQQRQPTNQAGVFQNINGRCFFGDGGAEGLILDDRPPAIHAQPNQNLGIGTPQQPLPNTGGNLTGSGTGYVFGNGATGSIYVNHPNPSNRLGTILAADTSVTISKIDPTYAGIYSGALMASTVANVDAVTSNITPFTAPGSGISITTGTSLVTLVGGTWPAGWQYAGLSINFNGYSFVILSHGVISAVNGVDLNGNALALTNVQLLILGVYDGPTLTNVPYTITGCQVTMKDTGGGNNVNTLSTVNTNIAAVPPGVALGYSQSTASNLVQVKVDCVRANGLLRNLGNISLGPEGALALHVIHDGLMPKDSFILKSASAPFAATDVGSTIIVDGADTGVGSLLVTTITDFKNSSQVWLGAENGTGANVVAALAIWGPKLQGIPDATMGAGSTTLTSASNPWTIGNIGDTIIIAAAGPGGKALLTTIVGFTTPGHVTVGTASTGAVAGVQAYWQDILAGTTVGPTYAYAWYDPETGHCSNISPLYQIAAPTAIGTYSDFANLTPVFQIDQGLIAYPDQVVDGIRFSHIMFFRTLSTPGSSTLYPIGSLNPFVGKVHPGSGSTRGSWNPSTFHGWSGLPNNYTAAPTIVAAPNYWYDWSSDSDLLLSGGFRAPQETNSKPMVLMRGGATQAGRPFALAYWDRRTWIINTQDPHTVQFSCDEAQCPLGLPEESFPPTNVLQIPADDGVGVALKTVGDVLLLTTQRWAYQVVGNNESNYRLMKVSASMPGVGFYQMDEFPTATGAEGEPSTLFYLGRDRIVYQWTFGAQAVPISMPIQDQLDRFLTVFPPLQMYVGSRLHCVSAFGRRAVAISPYMLNAVGTGIQTYMYDIDNQIWSNYQRTGGVAGELYGGTAPMTTVRGAAANVVNEMYSIYSNSLATVICGSWLNDTVTSAQTLMEVTTFPMNFDGRKTRKRIVGINIHATATVNPWVGAIRVNECPFIVFPFASYPDPLDSIYGAGASPVEGNLQDSVLLTGAILSPILPLIGYRFIIDVQSPTGSTDPLNLYAIDISYQDEEEPGMGDP